MAESYGAGRWGRGRLAVTVLRARPVTCPARSDGDVPISIFRRPAVPPGATGLATASVGAEPNHFLVPSFRDRNPFLPQGHEYRHVVRVPV